MNKVRDLQKLIQSEHAAGIQYGPASWHWSYRRSPYIYIGNLDGRLSEGDLLVVFSQFGEIVDIKLSRDKSTGDSRGFGWIAYEDPRSKILAIEEMCGAELLGRTIYVDHASKHQNGQNVTKISTLATTIATNSNQTTATLVQPAGQSGSGLALLSGVGKKAPTTETPKIDSQRKSQSSQPKALTGNLVNDIDDTQFEDDEDLEERRRMVWDYEAFYLDSDDETACQLLYNRLKSGDKLIRNEQNQIVTEEEHIFDQQLAARQRDTDATNRMGSILSLDDLERIHQSSEIDQFNSTVVTPSRPDPNHHTTTKSANNPLAAPRSFDDIWSRGAGIDDTTHHSGDNESDEKDAAEMVKKMGFTLGSFAKGLSKGPESVSFDVLEKLRINRLKRETGQYEDYEGEEERERSDLDESASRHQRDNRREQSSSTSSHRSHDRREKHERDSKDKTHRNHHERDSDRSRGDRDRNYD